MLVKELAPIQKIMIEKVIWQKALCGVVEELLGKWWQSLILSFYLSFFLSVSLCSRWSKNITGCCFILKSPLCRPRHCITAVPVARYPVPSPCSVQYSSLQYSGFFFVFCYYQWLLHFIILPLRLPEFFPTSSPPFRLSTSNLSCSHTSTSRGPSWMSDAALMSKQVTIMMRDLHR